MADRAELRAVIVDDGAWQSLQGWLTSCGYDLAAVHVGTGQMPRYHVNGVGLPFRPDDSGLTEDELDVLRGIAEGKTAGAISRELRCSVEAIKTRIRRIFTKLEVKDRASAVAAGFRRGIIGAGTDPVIRTFDARDRA